MIYSIYKYFVSRESPDTLKKKQLYTEYKKKRRINTRLVRATWKRVFVSSIIYALALNFARVFYIELFGKPTFFDVRNFAEEDQIQK